MQVLWLLDMKGIPIHCSKSRKKFVTFHYRIFSTVVFKTKTTLQKKGVKLLIKLTKLCILYLLKIDFDSESRTSFELLSEDSESINVLM